MARDNQRERERLRDDEDDEHRQRTQQNHRKKRRGSTSLVSDEERRHMILLRGDIERQLLRADEADRQEAFRSQIGSIERELLADAEGRSRQRRGGNSDRERRPRRDRDE